MAGAARGARQRGSVMLEVSLGLLLAAIAAYGMLRENLNQREMEAAFQDGDALATYRQALQNYVDEFYGPLQADAPVTKNGVTLAPGDGEGQTRQPSVANLIAMGYLQGFSNTLQTSDDAKLVNKIYKFPAGCVGLACNIDGLAYPDRPILARGSVDINGRVIGYMLARIGGNAGTSIEGASAEVIGAGASWAAPNPVAGQPAGIVAARFGYSASMMTSYVRMNDTRDPNLQGKFTVAGDVAAGANLAVTGNTTMTGTLDVTGNTKLTTAEASGQIKSSVAVGASDSLACLRAALQSSGEILSRAADCIVRFSVSPNTGAVSVNDASGASRVAMAGDTASINLKTAGGSDVIALDGQAGRVTAQSLNAKTASTTGTACSAEGDIVTDISPTGTVLVCRGGLWRRPGLEEQAQGAACPTNGQLAQTGSKETLICRSGVWFLMNDRISPVIPRELWSGNGPAAVPAPSCGVNGVPDITVSAVHSGADYGGAPPRNRFELRVTGAGPWSVTPVLVDETGSAFTSSFSGSAYSFGWTATTYCRYTE